MEGALRNPTDLLSRQKIFIWEASYSVACADLWLQQLHCHEKRFANEARSQGSFKAALISSSKCVQGNAGDSTSSQGRPSLQARPRATALKESQPRAPGLGHIDWSAGPHPVERTDLVLAIPTDNLHLELVEAGRQWHKVCSHYEL